MTQPATNRQPTATVRSTVDELVTAHLPVVGHLVREMLTRVPAHVRREDLFSAGSAALVEAALSFDHDRGTPFTAFATMRIRGALLDELRGLDWATDARQVAAVRDDVQRATLRGLRAAFPAGVDGADGLIAQRQPLPQERIGHPRDGHLHDAVQRFMVLRSARRRGPS